MKCTTFFHFRSALFILFSLLIFASCKSKKIPQSDIPIIPTDTLVSRFLNPPDIKYVNAKARIRINDDFQNQKATLFIRAQRDSAIFLVFKKLSVEGGRALITPDSVYIINRMEKAYQIIPLKDIQEDYGIMPDFNYIYDMLTGITPQVDTSKYWQLHANPNTLMIETMIKGLFHRIEIDRKTGHTISGHFMDNIRFNATWEYENFQLITDSISLPYNRMYDIQLPEYQNLKITLDFSEIELNIANSINFKIPSHYQLIE